MRLWLEVRREVAGAWHSTRYDLGRQISRRRATRLGPAETAGFAPLHHKGLHVTRRPKRIAATSGVVLLVAGGAAGMYLAVAGSLTALTAQAPPQPQPAAPFQAAPALRVSTQPAVPAPEPTRLRPQVRRSAVADVAPPAIERPPTPAAVPSQAVDPESTPTAGPSPSASSETASPSPSVSEPSASSAPLKWPKWGRHGDEDTAAGQSGDGL